METMSCLKLVYSKSSSLNLRRFWSNKCLDKCPRIPKPVPWKSMWGDPTCKLTPCPMLKPLDAYYYKPSNKLTKKYQQTWNECPDREAMNKIICTYPQYKYPEPERRKRKERLCEDPCTQTPDCKIEKLSRCTKIRMPGCRTVRDPPKCHNYKKSGCEKEECPEMCYTECNKQAPNEKVSNDCGCLHVRSITEVYCKIWSQGLLLCPKGKSC